MTLQLSTRVYFQLEANKFRYHDIRTLASTSGRSAKYPRATQPPIECPTTVIEVSSPQLDRTSATAYQYETKTKYDEWFPYFELTMSSKPKV